MRNRKRSRAELENDLDAKAAPGTDMARAVLLMELISTEEVWLDYWKRTNQPAPRSDELVKQWRAELHELLDKPALSNDELIIQKAARDAGARAVIIGAHNPEEMSDEWLSSAGAIVYRTGKDTE